MLVPRVLYCSLKKHMHFSNTGSSLPNKALIGVPGARCEILSSRFEKRKSCEPEITISDSLILVSTHALTFFRKASSGIGTGSRPSPGFQPQSTKWCVHVFHNLFHVSTTICFGSLSRSHKSWSLRPCQIIGISGDGKCQP